VSVSSFVQYCYLIIGSEKSIKNWAERTKIYLKQGKCWSHQYFGLVWLSGSVVCVGNASCFNSTLLSINFWQNCRMVQHTNEWNVFSVSSRDQLLE